MAKGSGSSGDAALLEAIDEKLCEIASSMHSMVRSSKEIAEAVGLIAVPSLPHEEAAAANIRREQDRFAERFDPR